MKTSLSVFLLFLAFSASPAYAGPPAQPGTGVPSQHANSWMPVKLRATQSLTLPTNHPKFKALAGRTQKDLEDIGRTMDQIGDLKSSKQPNKVLARRILEQLRQHRLQLQQTEKELAAIGRSRSGRKAGPDPTDSKRKEIMESMADDEIEAAESGYDDAKEQYKKALRILEEHVERETQVVQKITS